VKQYFQIDTKPDLFVLIFSLAFGCGPQSAARSRAPDYVGDHG
jgi:hypothetical protein